MWKKQVYFVNCKKRLTQLSQIKSNMRCYPLNGRWRDGLGSLSSLNILAMA